VQAELVVAAGVSAEEGDGGEGGAVGRGSGGREEAVVPGIFIFVTQHIIMKFSKTPEGAFFSSWYFLVNATLVFSYPLLRLFTSIGQRDLRNRDTWGFTYENSIIYAGLSFIAMYYIRSASLREFFLDCLTIGKICVASLLFFAKFKFSLFYTAFCLLSWVALSYPKYRGKNKFIKIESEEHFNSLVGDIVEAKKPAEDEEYQPYQYRNKKMFFV
jgi:hypothetical protein